MVGSVPSAIGPSSWSLSASATSLMAAACSSTRAAMATIFSPSGVGRIFCLPRSNSTPSSSSSFFTAMDSVGWLTWQRSAARPKCCSCARATM